MSFNFEKLTALAPDPIYNLMVGYMNDKNDKKINVGIGAYRDDFGNPIVLKVVEEAKSRIINLDHEYLPIAGHPEFLRQAKKLIVGENNNELFGIVQAVSGTGALRVAGQFIHEQRPNVAIYISDPSWMNHRHVFESCKLSVKTYRYYKDKGIDFEGCVEDLNSAPDGSVIVLHACAHNPTGYDFTEEQWKIIGQILMKKQHLPLFDNAYQGFASGDLDKDIWAVRHFVNDLKIECLIATSFSKNFGLYGERAGCLIASCKSENAVNIIESHFARITRGICTTCPAFGARIVATILSDSLLTKQWKEELWQMSQRIIKTRKDLRHKLENMKTPGDWTHITTQIGMFSFTGLTVEQSLAMRSKYSIYMTENGRISMCGLNSSNLDYFVGCLDNVVRDIK